MWLTDELKKDVDNGLATVKAIPDLDPFDGRNIQGYVRYPDGTMYEVGEDDDGPYVWTYEGQVRPS